ncbi:MAG: hypothetical protein AAF268_15980 [Cyanobacteria bacterium P01_A01_bin.3]
MRYSFELIGITPILDFFNHQQHKQKQIYGDRAEYIGSYHCSLDRFLSQLQDVPPERQWDMSLLSQAVVDYWIASAHSIQYWQERLSDAGDSCLVVGRVANTQALRGEFEAMLMR